MEEKVEEHIARWLDEYEDIISDVEDEEFASAIRGKIMEISHDLREQKE